MGIIQSKSSPYIHESSDYNDGKSLDKFLDTKPILSDELVLLFGLDLCRGMQCVHLFKLGPIGNLHPKNVYVNSQSLDYNDVRLKIRWCNKIPFSSLASNVETFPYTAPEIFSNLETANEKSDVYSFAVILWRMVNETEPFSEIYPSLIPPSIVSGLRPTISNATNNFVSELIERCWSEKQKNRPSFEQLQDLFIGEILKYHVSQGVDVSQFGTSYPELHNLILTNFSGLTNYTLSKLTQKLHHLKKISLKGCPNVTNLSIIELSQRFPDLLFLNVSKCDQITDEAISTLSRNCIYLEHLEVEFCRNLSDVSISELGRNCHKLITLNLGGCQKITNKSLLEVVRGSSTIENLSLHLCPRITDEIIIELADTNKNLNKLDLHYCIKITDTPFFNIAKNCTKLQYLDLGGCEKVTSAPLIDIVQNCTDLRYLNLSKCDINDKAINELSLRSHNLTFLNVSFCVEITDKSILGVGIMCANLEEIYLSGCVHLTEKSISELFNCPKLQKISLSGCLEITDFAIIEISKKCRELKYFNIGGCKKITDKGLIEFASRCATLEGLEVFDCNIGNSAVMEIANYCPKLKHVNFSGCKNVSENSVIYLVEKCTALKKIEVFGSMKTARNQFQHKSHIIQWIYDDDPQ